MLLPLRQHCDDLHSGFTTNLKFSSSTQVQGSVSTTPVRAVTWDNHFAFLSRCQGSIYNFNLKPDVNGLFCTVLTQDLTFMQSIQSGKSAFSEGREGYMITNQLAHVSFKIVFFKLNFT